MNKVIKKISDRSKKNISRFIFRRSVKDANESKFWGKIALKQQVLIHAKNST